MNMIDYKIEKLEEWLVINRIMKKTKYKVKERSEEKYINNLSLQIEDGVIWFNDIDPVRIDYIKDVCILDKGFKICLINGDKLSIELA